jgi:hypothetical protein
MHVMRYTLALLRTRLLTAVTAKVYSGMTQLCYAAIAGHQPRCVSPGQHALNKMQQRSIMNMTFTHHCRRPGAPAGGAGHLGQC